MKTMKFNINSIFAVIFLVLSMLALYGVMAKGAWWHTWTSLICFLLFQSFRRAAKEDNDQDPDKEDPYIEE